MLLTFRRRSLLSFVSESRKDSGACRAGKGGYYRSYLTVEQDKSQNNEEDIFSMASWLAELL